jgi:RNA-binding protein
VTPAEKKQLRARAHTLKPVIMIGQSGLSTAVLAEIELALTTHELIKIKIQSDDRVARNQLSTELCSKSNADLIQSIGKTVIVYRNNPNN